jgi:hypothetical protein
MKFGLALGGLICFGLMSGSAYAVTAGTNASTPAPAAVTPAEDTATDSNASAEENSNPYWAIVKKNVFKLTDPPKPVQRDDPAIMNLPKVNISGFKRREGEPVRALFATVPKDPKESPTYFNLGEGEKDGILEVKRIDPNQESVDVIIAGTPTTLTVKSNSFVQPLPVAKPGGPSPIPNPGIVARPPVAVPTPPPMANPNPAPSYGGGVVVGGGGSVSTPSASSVTTIGGGQANFGGGAPNPGVVNGGGSPVAPNGGAESRMIPVPTRGIRTPNYTPGQYQPQSIDEAHAHAYLYNEVNKPQIEAGELPPGPPLPQ